MTAMKTIGIAKYITDIFHEVLHFETFIMNISFSTFVYFNFHSLKILHLLFIQMESVKSKLKENVIAQSTKY